MMPMTWEQFISKLEQTIEQYPDCEYIADSLQDETQCYLDMQDRYLVKSWLYNEATGGSCWGNKAYEIGGDPEPPDTVLEIVTDSYKLSHDQWMNIMSLVSENTRFWGDDYYGNYREYSYRGFNLKALYDMLVSFDSCDS